MRVTTRAGNAADLPFLHEVDRHVPPATVADLVSAGRVMVAEVDGDVVGLLRWSLFWDRVPFMNLVWILVHWRGQGVGTALIDAWEKHQHAAGTIWC